MNPFVVSHSNSLFNSKTIKKLCADIQITEKQRDSARKWLDLLAQNKLEDEKSNYLEFVDVILKNILGYDRIIYEKNNVEFQIPDSSDRNVLCFEVKGTSTKDLFARQHRDKKEQETPIKQTWSYIGENSLDYGICTNYDSFILITKVEYPKFHKFDFHSIRNNEEKLKEFIGVFSRERIIEKGFVEKAVKDSILEEKEITKKLYKLFHQTRLMLIKEFQENPEVRKDEAIHYAQLYLNRLIFIFFAKDNGLITDKRILTKKIHQVLETPLISEHSKLVSDQILSIFQALDKGSKMMGIDEGFNGGLFQQQIPTKIYFSDMRDPSFFENIKKSFDIPSNTSSDEITNIIKKYSGKINEIILNILKMDSYDFKSDVNVNILGHIFEQSISDLEELRGLQDSKRKKDGVYYTPEYITDYVCRNTILPYLSKMGVTTVSDLVSEYSDNINELEKKIKNIRILDPACGSGAFLIKAAEILLEIDKEIQNSKPQIPDQSQLKSWSEESEISKIIEGNIHGVDINEESVEITKLSLFLKLASPNKKLIDLSNNIKVGNSIIDDVSIDPKGFDWKNEFKDVFDNGGFDIIVGNPPYVRVQLLDHKVIDWLKSHKNTAYKRIDISTLFFELTKSLLKKNGFVSFITSNQFQVAEYGTKIRDFIPKNFQIIRIIDFGDLPVFEDALTYVSIFTFQNVSDAHNNFDYLRIYNLDDAKNIDNKKFIKFESTKLGSKPWILKEENSLKLLEKLKKYKTIEEIGRTGYGLITGLDEVLLLSEDKVQNLKIEKEILLPVIVGTDPDRYAVITPTVYAIYPYKLSDNETKIITEDELHSKYPNAYQYLLDNKKKLEARKDSRKTFQGRKDWYGLVRFGMLDNFLNDKIITPGEVKDHKFTIDHSKSGFLAARIFCIVVEDKNYDLRYVLALLNSKVVKFFLHNTAPLKQGGYYGYSSAYLDKVPIPKTNSTSQNNLIVKVDELLSLNSILNEKREKFLSRLQNNLNVKITQNLASFYSKDFSSFIKELLKQKVKLSLKDQDEWENYFSEYKQQILELLEKIKKTDNMIEEFALKVYDVDDKEEKILEENLNQ